MFARVRYADGARKPSRLPAAAASSAATGITGGGSGPSGRPWTRHSQLWQPAAAWFARRARAQGREPVSVTLVRRWRELLPPGPGPSRGEWRYAFYTYDVSGAREAEAP